MPGVLGLSDPGHKTVIGMVHLSPLPGTPFHEEGQFPQILERAVDAARALDVGGADGCLVQTVDRVYSVDDDSDPARTVAMGLIVREIVRATGKDFEVGVQLMRNALRASLAVAKVAGGSFIRAGGLVGMTLTAHGMVTAQPLRVMEYRAKIHAQDIKVIADIDSQHYRWFEGGKPTAQVAGSAAFVGADAVALGSPDDERTLAMIASVRAAQPDLPIILAGHTDHDNAGRLLAAADGAFVGTCLQPSGWGGPIDVERVRAYVRAARSVAP
ncbi:MAG: BtpA/SgcQ family protein [Pseudonocardiaceae bacterium]